MSAFTRACRWSLPSDAADRLPSPRIAVRNHTGLPLRHIVESRVIEQFAPAHVVVTRDGDIVHFSTRTGKYLENARRRPDPQCRRDGAARAAARSADRADRGGGDAAPGRCAHGLHVEIDDRVQFLDLTIEPLPDHDAEPLFLIVFCDIGAPLAPDRRLPALIEDQSAADEQLERELREARERLQSMVEEYETALEELKSANEELVSINEELQSTNEELETSREEAQSVNEELQTVNNELQRKVEELNEANDNLRNLFEVHRDRHGHPRPQPADPQLHAGDHGHFQPDGHRSRTAADRYRQRARRSRSAAGDRAGARTGQSRERRVVSRDGRAHYLMRVLPYRTAERPVDGVLVTFTDITRIAEAEAHRRSCGSASMRCCGSCWTGRAQPAGRSGVGRAARPAAGAGRHLPAGVGGGLGARCRWPSWSAGSWPISGSGARGGSSWTGRRCWCGRTPPSISGWRCTSWRRARRRRVRCRCRRGGSISIGRSSRRTGAERRLVIRWRESGGPAGETPERRYARELIERGLAEQIGASLSVSPAEGGLTAEIALPLASGLVLLPGPEGK